MVLILGAETADALTAVNIENPHGYSVFSGDPREKVGKGLGVIVILNDELAFWIEAVFWFGLCDFFAHFTIKLIIVILHTFPVLSMAEALDQPKSPAIIFSKGLSP